MINKQCVVVFPVYKKLSKLELAFFENGLQKNTILNLLLTNKLRKYKTN